MTTFDFSMQKVLFKLDLGFHSVNEINLVMSFFLT